MFFAHWSSTDSSYRDMERRELHCERCNEDTQHTFRYHITKTKHYSVVSIGAGEHTLTFEWSRIVELPGVSTRYSMPYPITVRFTADPGEQFHAEAITQPQPWKVHFGNRCTNTSGVREVCPGTGRFIE